MESEHPYSRMDLPLYKFVTELPCPECDDGLWGCYVDFGDRCAFYFCCERCELNFEVSDVMEPTDNFCPVAVLESEEF